MSNYIKILHQTQGRLRLKLLGEKDLQKQEQVIKHLVQQEQITRWSCNSITQTFLIYHKEDANKLFHHLTLQGFNLLKIEKENNPLVDGQVSHIRTGLRTKLRVLDDRIKEHTGGEIDLGMITGGVLLGMAYYQTFKKNTPLPAGETLFATALKFILDGR